MSLDHINNNKEWKVMEYAYNSAYFNTYLDGPGADLDENLQPRNLATNKVRGKFQLYLKNVPDDFTGNGIKNLCSKFGKVVQITEPLSKSYKFVTFETLNDMTNALAGLRSNSFGIVAQIAKGKKVDETVLEALPEYYTPDESEKTVVQKTYKSFFASPDRPMKIEKTAFVTQKDYENSNLKVIDPQRNFLIENDMHYQDRKLNNDVNKFGRFIFTGRAYYVESETVVNDLRRLSQKSTGQYGSEKNIFFKSLKKVDLHLLPNCVYCSKWAAKVCEKSGSHYCSLECQTKDVNFHNENAKNNEIFKRNCNVTLDLQSSLNSPFELIIAELPKNGSRIIITTIIQTNLFFVRSFEYNDNIDYIRTINMIDYLARDAETLTEMPEKGDLLLCCFKETGYFRVLVLNAENENQITVIYVDFGNVEIRKLHELKQPSSSIFTFKCHAISIKLKGVPNSQPLPIVKDYLNSLIDNVNLDLILVYNENENEGKEVEIINGKDNENINKKIMQLNQIKAVKDSDPPIFKNDIELKIFAAGENIEVLVLDNSQLEIAVISCILQDDLISLQELNEKLNNYGNTTTGPYTPRKAEMCVAKYEKDEQWYRGECLEVIGDGEPTILFTDYGNILPVSIDHIRQYPIELTKYECKTVVCFIADLPQNVEQKVAEKLKQLIPINSKLVISKIETGKDGETLIYIPEIIEELKEEGLM